MFNTQPSSWESSMPLQINSENLDALKARIEEYNKKENAVIARCREERKKWLMEKSLIEDSSHQSENE